MEARGLITSVDPGLSPSFLPGQIFTMVYSYESDTVDQNPSAERGDYWGALISLEFATSTYDLSARGGEIIIGNDRTSGSPDLYQVSAREIGGSSPVDLQADVVATRFPYYIALELNDDTGGAFDSDELLSAGRMRGDPETTTLVLHV